MHRHAPTATGHRLLHAGVLLLASCLASAASGQGIRPATASPERELLREFFDSLSDIAITLDRLQVYQRNGQRREVDLFGEAVLSLDETRPSLLSNPRGTPLGAGRAGRALGLSSTQRWGTADVLYERRDGLRHLGWQAMHPVSDAWSLAVQSNDLRSDLADVPGQPITGLRRRDTGVGLRWRGQTQGGTGLGAELSLRHSVLEPSPATALAPAGSGDFLFLRGQAQPAQWTGLGLTATYAHPVRSEAGMSPDLREGRLEWGAEWRLGPGHPMAFLPAGSRLALRDAPQLGLLSDDEALTRTAAYHRNVALEVPDGSPGGSWSAQLRRHSLASAEDAQAAVGWRHGWRLPSGWGLESRLEQAVPLSGPTAVRATQAGARAWISQFPFRTTSVDVNAVTSTLADSAYAGWQITQRLADDWLSNLQLSTSHAQPHGRPGGAIEEHKAAVAVAWREPQARAVHLLTRLAWANRQLGPQYGDPRLGERRAWTWLGHAGLLLDDERAVSMRMARRIEHNAVVWSPNPRTTNVLLTRWIHELPSRWSASAHLAQRIDTRDGRALGFGAEIGRRLSQRLTLALGFNPRGFSDNELTLDERPQRGITLRLRFTVEGVLGRWLDAGRADGRPSARAWEVPEPGITPDLRTTQWMSPLGLP